MCFVIEQVCCCENIEAPILDGLAVSKGSLEELTIKLRPAEWQESRIWTGKGGAGKGSAPGKRKSILGVCLCKDPKSKDTLAIHKLKRVCMIAA